MSVTIIFKIAALGIVVAVLSQILKHSGREEQAFLLSLAGLIIVLFWIVPCIGIAAVFLALLLKKEKGELALLVGIAASVLIFGYTLSRISFILDFLRELMDTLPVDPALLKALLKMLGITYVADFSASVCREAGYGSVAGQIELFAKLSIVALSIPELWVLLRLIEQMTGG